MQLSRVQEEEKGAGDGDQSDQLDGPGKRVYENCNSRSDIGENYDESTVVYSIDNNNGILID